ncbi:MAG: DUF1573 domain-containing protein [Luteolibacter sp.]
MKICALLFFLIGILPLSAALKFEESKISAKAGLDEVSLSRDFKFTNDGKTSVTIKAADAGCSCISTEISGGKFTYAPGESGVLRANFEVGSFQGTVEKPIHIWLEGDPDESPSSTVVLSVSIPTIIALEPKTLKWKVGDDTAPKVIDVQMTYEKPIRVTSVDTSNKNFNLKLIIVEEGKHYQVEVTPLSSKSPGLSVVRIETDVDVPKQRSQQAFAVIAAPHKQVP